jgi:hypothetical protein
VARNDVIPEAVLSKLLSACPQALNMTDLVKETPLDLVESRRNEIQNVEVIIKQLKVGG